MNRLALQAVAAGGLFLTCSCTGLVQRGDVPRNAAPGRVAGGPDGAGAQGGRGRRRTIRSWLHVPEGRYLKAVFCRVAGCRGGTCRQKNPNS